MSDSTRATSTYDGILAGLVPVLEGFVEAWVSDLNPSLRGHRVTATCHTLIDTTSGGPDWIQTFTIKEVDVMDDMSGPSIVIYALEDDPEIDSLIIQAGSYISPGGWETEFVIVRRSLVQGGDEVVPTERIVISPVA